MWCHEVTTDWICKIDGGLAKIQFAQWMPDSRHILTIDDFNLRASIWNLQYGECVASYAFPLAYPSLFPEESSKSSIHSHTKRGIGLELKAPILSISPNGQFLLIATKKSGRLRLLLCSTESWQICSEYSEFDIFPSSIKNDQIKTTPSDFTAPIEIGGLQFLSASKVAVWTSVECPLYCMSIYDLTERRVVQSITNSPSNIKTNKHSENSSANDNQFLFISPIKHVFIPPPLSMNRIIIIISLDNKIRMFLMSNPLIELPRFPLGPLVRISKNTSLPSAYRESNLGRYEIVFPVTHSALDTDKYENENIGENSAEENLESIRVVDLRPYHQPQASPSTPVLLSSSHDGTCLGLVHPEFPCVVFLVTTWYQDAISLLIHSEPVKNLSWDPSPESKRVALVCGNRRIFLWTPTAASTVVVPSGDIDIDKVSWRAAVEDKAPALLLMSVKNGLICACYPSVADTGAVRIPSEQHAHRIPNVSLSINHNNSGIIENMTNQQQQHQHSQYAQGYQGDQFSMHEHMTTFEQVNNNSTHGGDLSLMSTLPPSNRLASNSATK